MITNSDWSSKTLSDICNIVCSNAGMGICGRFKLPSVFSPTGGISWFRLWMISQNPANNTTYQTGISIIATNESNVFHGILNGNVSTAYTVSWRKLTYSNWIYAGEITGVGTSYACTLPSEWNECNVISTTGLWATLVNNQYGRTRLIVNVIKVDTTGYSTFVCERATIKATTTTVYVANKNEEGSWISGELETPYWVIYR